MLLSVPPLGRATADPEPSCLELGFLCPLGCLLFVLRADPHAGSLWTFLERGPVLGALQTTGDEEQSFLLGGRGRRDSFSLVVATSKTPITSQGIPARPLKELITPGPWAVLLDIVLSHVALESQSYVWGLDLRKGGGGRSAERGVPRPLWLSRLCHQLWGL